MLKKINELKRKKAIKNITGNLGFVVEKEDKLICYVQKEKFHFYGGFAVESYVIRIEDFKKSNSDLVEKYGLDKEIVYVLDGLTFDEKEPVKINVFDNDSRLEIKNCRFDRGVVINYPKECIIKNTIINTDYLRYECEIKASDLILDNVEINNNDNMLLFNKVRIYAKDSIKIRNSIIKADTCVIGNLNTRKVSIDESNLSTRKKVQIMAKDITTKGSSVISEEWISIYTRTYNKLLGLLLKANFIDINGKTLCKKSIETPVYLKALDDLDNSRLKLLNLLKSGIKDLESQREDKITLVKKNFNEQPVGRLILGRKK